MPTFNANVLPSSTGFDLGSAAQRWDAFLQQLDVSDTATFSGAINTTGAFGTALWNNVRIVDGSQFATIQAAIDDLPAGGGMVFIPAGTYTTASAITVSVDNTKLIGVRGATIIQFTGATDGIVLSGGTDFVVLDGLQIETTNASGLRAIELDGVSTSINSLVLRDILITSSGSGRWAHGLWADSWRTSYVYALEIKASATVGVRLQNASNANSFYGVEVNGTSGAGTINRAIELDGSSRVNFFGGTLQGNFEQSLIHLTGGRALFSGMHWENTDTSPSDGADIISISGNSATTFLNNDVGSYDIGSTGTVRGTNIIGGQSDGLTLGAGAQQCLVMGVRGPVAGFTDNGQRNTFLSNGDTTGASFANKGGGRRQWLADSTTTIPGTATIGAAAFLAAENNASFEALDSGGTSRIVWVPLTASDQTFFAYLPTEAMIWQNTDNVQKMQLSDSEFQLLSGVQLKVGDGGINNDGAGYKHTRIASGVTAASLHATASATWTFGTAFADTNYSITCTVDNPTGIPIVAYTENKAVGSIDIVIMAGSAAAASGTLNCIAVHD